MPQYHLFAIALCTFLARGLFNSAKTDASELDSAYISVHISPEQYRKWLQSPMKHMRDYDDWDQMTDEWDEGWKKDFYAWDCKTMGEMVDYIKMNAADAEAMSYDTAPYINYDPREGIFTFAQLLYGENFIDFMLDLSAYRAFADFKNTEEPDFMVIYPRMWDSGYAVIMEIGMGYTKFHTENTVPPAFQEFIKKANAHFGKEIASLGG